MVKTISIPDDLHKELIKLKLDYGDKNVGEIIKKLVYEHRKRQFLEFSNLFRQKLKEKGISFEEFLKRAEKTREEVADELFPNL